jgi:hypothetical protein
VELILDPVHIDGVPRVTPACHACHHIVLRREDVYEFACVGVCVYVCVCVGVQILVCDSAKARIATRQFFC